MNILKDRGFILFHVVVFVLIGVLSWVFAYSDDEYIKYFCIKILWVSKTSENSTLAIIMYLPLLVYVYGFYKAYKAKIKLKNYILLVALGLVFYSICYFLFAGILMYSIDML